MKTLKYVLIAMLAACPLFAQEGTSARTIDSGVHGITIMAKQDQSSTTYEVTSNVQSNLTSIEEEIIKAAKALSKAANLTDEQKAAFNAALIALLEEIPNKDKIMGKDKVLEMSTGFSGGDLTAGLSINLTVNTGEDVIKVDTKTILDGNRLVTTGTTGPDYTPIKEEINQPASPRPGEPPASGPLADPAPEMLPVPTGAPSNTTGDDIPDNSIIVSQP